MLKGINSRVTSPASSNNRFRIFKLATVSLEIIEIGNLL